MATILLDCEIDGVNPGVYTVVVALLDNQGVQVVGTNGKVSIPGQPTTPVSMQPLTINVK